MKETKEMWIADGWKDYELIDTSDGLRLERWGKYTLVRPDPQVIWRGVKQDPLWKKADGVYSREGGGGKWSRLAVPESWNIGYGSSLNFKIKPMGFKHTGLFPEQAVNWDWFSELIAKANRPVKVLNLFAYTGGATIAAAAAGASVCHVDASKGMVTAKNLLNARYAEEISTTVSSWTLLPMAEAPAVRYGSLKNASEGSFPPRQSFFPTIRSFSF